MNRLEVRHVSHNSIDKHRHRLLSWTGIGLFAAAGLTQARVQVVDRDDIINRANKTDRFIVSQPEFAKRGGIFDREGKPLAQDEDTRFLTVCFDKSPKSPAFYMELAAATGIPASEFAAVSSSKAPVDWKRPLGASQASAVLAVKQKWRADGVGLSRSGRRSYPLGEAGAGLIGAMRDKTPLSGVELGLNKTLAGTDGKIVGIVDREGNYLPMRLDKETVKRRDGATITLTIDSEIQQVAAEAVRHAVDINKADQGVAIVMDPKNGNILAMANWPSFDPNRPIEPSASGRTPEFNGAYMGTLEPGSTFKILTLAKALDKGVVQPDETYYCRGTMTVGKTTFGCDREHGAHGLLSTTDAIARSCNLAAANWALRVGRDEFVTFMEQLGLMEKPGLGLPRESAGLYNYKEYAKNLQVANNGFGQSMNYTPLALCAAFATLANNGQRVFPRLVERIDDQVQPVREGMRVFSEEAAHQVQRMMRAVFESDRGTAKGLRIAGYALGGKTGTAQKKNFSTGTMKGGGHVSNFVGFLPAENPEAVILVMIDNPKAGRYYGSVVAGPAFRTIAQTVLRKLHLPRVGASTEEDRTLGRRTSGPRVVEEPQLFEEKDDPARKQTSDAKEPAKSTPKATPKAPEIQVTSKRITPSKAAPKESSKESAKPTEKRSETSSEPVRAGAPRRTRTTEAPKTPTDRQVKPTIKAATKQKAEPARVIRIIEPEPKRAASAGTSNKSAPMKVLPSRPAEIETRRSSAIRLEGGLAPKLGRSGSPRTSTSKKPAVKPDQSPVTPKRVNRDR